MSFVKGAWYMHYLSTDVYSIADIDSIASISCIADIDDIAVLYPIRTQKR